MTRHLIPFLLVFALSCGDNGDTSKETDTDTDADSDADTDADTDTDTDADADWPTGAPDWEWSGDLSDGVDVDLDWADSSSVACFPGTENMNFNGNHVIYEITEDADRDLFIRLNPADGVDVSLYAMQFSGSAQIPPDVDSCRICEAAFDQVNDSNPGENETLHMLGHNKYQVVIGVAGANHATSGAYTLKIWDAPGQGFDSDR